ncbi:MAG: hypothetical protein HFE63_08250 [Clostridiales bacterium]|nr:hypothetical protein [Clostridiales bacterium]
MKLSINYNVEAGKIKPMNAVNNGPVYTKNADRNSGNLPEYTVANIHVPTHTTQHSLQSKAVIIK